jgi:cell division transport system permease protein
VALGVPGLGESGLGLSLRTLARGGEGALLAQPRLIGPMPWVIAIMVALTVIAAAAGLAASNMARSAADTLAGGITVQIVEANPALREAQAEAAAQRLAATPGVATVRRVSPAEVARLIEPWLGGLATDGQDIPVPAMVDVRLRGAVTGERLGALRRTLREVAPSARLDAQSSWLRPVFGAIDSLRLLALALVGLLATALAAVVLLAVRNALGSNRETIEIVHLLGGTDQQIARLFQRSVGFDAAGGGALGLALGVAAVLLLGQQFAGLDAGLVSGGTLGWADWLVLALVPVAGAALAMLTARWTVVRALRRML